MSPSKAAVDQNQEDRILNLERGQKEVLDLLRPISETYRTVSTLGKWFMAFMVFVSILIGILLGAKSIFHK